MARSSYLSFGLTADDPNGATATQSGELGGAETQATDRYLKAELTSTYSYPLSEEVDGFYIPMMHFKFYDASGLDVGSSPVVKIRVPNNFNVTNFSEYSRTENIFGADAPRKQIYGESGAEKIEGMAGELKADDLNEYTALKYGASASEAFLYAIRKSLGGVSGFLQSGGLNALAQYEFERRAAVNPYAQLLYKGPQFRRYQVPLVIRPRSKTEATNALNIIKIFKIASSPTVQNRAISFGDVSGTLQSFSFGYPHLTQFDIKFKVDGSTNQDIFKSKLCAIESVAVDYGGQKMAFFEDGVPTEITMTLQLSEVSVRTLGDARLDADSQRTIL
jgi:hypothetical protein